MGKSLSYEVDSDVSRVQLFPTLELAVSQQVSLKFTMHYFMQCPLNFNGSDL